MLTEKRPATAVWINADEALIWRWRAGAGQRVQRLVSDVPAHHKSTGHVGETGGERHGGTGARSAQEGHRLEHLRAFVVHVEAYLPDDDLLLIGDGVVVEHLAVRLNAADATHGRERRIEIAHSGPLTDRQLVARLRAFAGDPAPRRKLRR